MSELSADKNMKTELVRKLRALAERGIGGEKDAAAQKLALLMEKYGLDEADLEDEKEEAHDFHFKTEFDQAI